MITDVVILCTQLEAGGAQRLAIWQQEILSSTYKSSNLFLYLKSEFMGLDAKSCLSHTGSKGPLNTIKIFLKLALKLRRAQIVIAHTHFAIASALAVKLLFQPTLIVIAVHHSERSLYSPMLARFIHSDYASRHLGDNVYVAEHIRSLNKGRVIHNPVIISNELLGENENFKELDLLFVGRLSKEKSLADLLRAIERTSDRKLTVIGEGPEKAELINIVDQLKISERVTFLGQKMPSEVHQYMRRCSAVVIPSRSEALPLVLLESISLGTVVYCSAIPAHRFAISAGAALGFEAGDIEGLSQILASKNGEILDKDSRKIILDGFHPDEIKKQWLDLLENQKHIQGTVR